MEFTANQSSHSTSKNTFVFTTPRSPPTRREIETWLEKEKKDGNEGIKYDIETFKHEREQAEPKMKGPSSKQLYEESLSQV